MMFLRLVRFNLNEDSRNLAQVVADDLIPAIKQQPGCASAVFFSGDDGACGLAVVWDSQEHADGASAIIRPKLDQHLSGHISAPPEVRLYPVLAS